jgi:hypothetical protein
MSAAACTGSLYVGRALPCEFHVVLNGMPQKWFEESPFLLHIQVARLISEGRFLIAQRGSQLLGGLAWQDDVAFGAYYAKLLFATDERQFAEVAARLMRELIVVAKEAQARAIFADLPEDSPLLKALDAVPGMRVAGYIDDFCEPGIKSVIVQFDLREADRLLRQADRMTVGPAADWSED